MLEPIFKPTNLLFDQFHNQNETKPYHRCQIPAVKAADTGVNVTHNQHSHVLY